MYLKRILRNNPIETLTYLSATAMRLKLLGPSGCNTVAHLKSTNMVTKNKEGVQQSAILPSLRYS